MPDFAMLEQNVCRKKSKHLDFFRHRFATAVLNRWLDEKKDLGSRLPYLQTYMGHRNLEATAYYYDKKSIMESKLAVTLEFTDTTARKTLHNYLPRLLSHCIRSWSSVQLLSQFGMGIGFCFESLSLSSAAFFIFKLAFA